MRRVLHFFLIFALFVTYQINLTHSIGQSDHDHTKCHICIASKDTHKVFYSINFILIDANILQSQHITQRVSYTSPINLTQNPKRKHSCFKGLKNFVVKATPLGYLSTAPPYFS